jgi:hypothetical protein
MKSHKKLKIQKKNPNRHRNLISTKYPPYLHKVCFILHRLKWVVLLFLHCLQSPLDFIWHETTYLTCIITLRIWHNIAGALQTDPLASRRASPIVAIPAWQVGPAWCGSHLSFTERQSNKGMAMSEDHLYSYLTSSFSSSGCLPRPL